MEHLIAVETSLPKGGVIGNDVTHDMWDAS